MPIGGERIGSAYIRIFGDGSGLPGDIRDALKESEPAVKASGRRLGEVYGEEFQNGLTRDQSRDFGKTLRENLEFGIAESDLTKAYFESEDWKRFNGRLREEFGEAGEVAGRQLQERFEAAGSGRGLSEAIKRNLIPQIRAATAEIAAEEKKLLAEQERLAREGNALEKELAADRIKILQAEIREAENAERERVAYEKLLYNERNKQYEAYVGRLKASTNDLQAAFQRLGTATQRSTDSQRDIIESVRELEASLGGVRSGGDRDHLAKQIYALRDAARSATPAADRFSNSMLRLGDVMGRSTGRGARNNFINLIGASVRGLTNLVTLGPRVAFAIGSQMLNAFETAGGGLAGIADAALTLGKSAGKGVAGLALVGGAAVLLVTLLGPIAALISGITAGLVAMGSTVVLGSIAGLVGALGVGGTLVAGLGVGVLAITKMSDEMKAKLQPGIDRVSDAFDRLGESAGDAIGPGLKTALDNIAPAISKLKPLTDAVARALGDVAAKIAKGFNSDGFERFIEQIGPFTANQIRNLGDAFQGFAEGVGGFFVAAKPLIRDFVNHLADIGEEFSDYANSKDGRQEIREFLEKAGDSAKSLGDFIGAATRALGQLFDKGAGAGNTIFDDLADAFQRYADYLADPANKGAIDSFFANGVEIARDFGRAIEYVFGLIGDLDTDKSREQLQDLFSTIGDVAGAFRDAAPFIVKLGDALGFISDYVDLAVESLKFLFEVAKSVATLDFTGIPDSLTSLGGAARKLGEGLGILEEAQEGVAGSTKVYDDIRTGFGNLAATAQNATGFTGDLARSLEDVTGAATDATKALIEEDLASAGQLLNIKRLGLNIEDVVNASLGREGAIKRVTRALGDGTQADQDALKSLLDYIGVTDEAVRGARNLVQGNNGITQSYKKLRGELGNKKLLVRLETKGIEPTLKGLARVISKNEELNTKANIKKLIEITGVPFSVAQLQRLIAKMKETNDQKPKPKIDLEDKPFQTVHDFVKNSLKKLGNEKAIPIMDADDKPFKKRLDIVLGDLKDVGNDTATPKIDADPGGFNGVLSNVNSALRGLPPRVVIDIIANQIGNFNPFGALGGTAGKGTLDPNMFQGLAGGGTVPGARTPYGDSFMAALAPGEEVISNITGQADRNRSLLKAINAGIPVTVGNGVSKTIDASGWTIVSPSSPSAVADEILVRLTAANF